MEVRSDVDPVTAGETPNSNHPTMAAAPGPNGTASVRSHVLGAAQRQCDRRQRPAVHAGRADACRACVRRGRSCRGEREHRRDRLGAVLGLNESLPAGKQLVGSSGSAGPTVTAGGLVFVGATSDGRFRAFDAKTGKELWVTQTAARRERQSPKANANPMTYRARAASSTSRSSPAARSRVRAAVECWRVKGGCMRYEGRCW